MTTVKTHERGERLRRFFFSSASQSVGGSTTGKRQDARKTAFGLVSEPFVCRSVVHYTTTTNVNVTLDGQTKEKIR